MLLDLESPSSSFIDCIDFDDTDVNFGLDDENDVTTSIGGDNHSFLDEFDDELFSATLSSETVPQVDASNEENALGLRAEILPNFYDNHKDNDYDETSFENQGQRGAPASKRSSLVTPEPPAVQQDHPATVALPQLPDPLELQRKYHHTMSKLFKSMRQSDATRSIVKRQKPLSFKSTKIQQTAVNNFFQSERCRELEASRRNLRRSLSA